MFNLGNRFGSGFGSDDDGQASVRMAQDSTPHVQPLDFHVDEVRQFSQWATDMNARWSMWTNEQTVKGHIFSILTKLEDKYQVRG